MNPAIMDWLRNIGIPRGLSPDTMSFLVLLAILALAYIVDIVVKRIMLRIIGIFVKKSAVTWDDIILEHNVFGRLAHLVPAILIYSLIHLIYPDSPRFISFIRGAAFLYVVFFAILALYSFLDALREIYRQYDVSNKFPLKGVVQAIKVLLFIIGLVLVLSAVTDKTPVYLLSGLGAFTAILLLIFKDAILGLVAGIQLSANDMVKEGDWIEMSQFGADGDVIDVSLTTVKVRNWDKTITSIPAYALVSSSFRNWRGMQESGGRRIKRALYIDMTSILFCDEEMIGRFSKIQYISEYVERKKEEIARWNRERQVDETDLINRRRLTNVGTFRAYVTAYLRNHPKIRQDMTFLVRQLQPTDHGLPLEIYVFSSDQVWANYESIQADIFDHLLAIVPEFDLRIFQSPSGADLRSLTK